MVVHHRESPPVPAIEVVWEGHVEFVRWRAGASDRSAAGRRARARRAGGGWPSGVGMSSGQRLACELHPTIPTDPT